MVRFSDLHEVQAELDALGARAEPLVVRLPRAPGQKEDRYAQLLGGPVGDVRSAQGSWSPGAPGTGPAAPAAGDSDHRMVADPATGVEGVPGAALAAEVAGLRAELSVLRAEVGALRRAMDDLREQLGA